jgi:hypothetical protein
LYDAFSVPHVPADEYVIRTGHRAFTAAVLLLWNGLHAICTESSGLDNSNVRKRAEKFIVFFICDCGTFYYVICTIEMTLTN